jgi:LPXTG-site transpeptidase (sortase) family protein
MTFSKGWLATAARCATVIGVFLLAAYAGATVYRVVALREFDQTRLCVYEDRGTVTAAPSTSPPEACCKNPRAENNLPLAFLRFERLNIRVPVFEGTDPRTLTRGTGWIVGTTRPGEAGAIGIAGHRGSFVRALRDLRQGDVLELVSAVGTATYTVGDFEIVAPHEVAVLRSGSIPSLMLVTCYPFAFVGAAPQRFVVHAVFSASRIEPAAGSRIMGQHRGSPRGER